MLQGPLSALLSCHSSLLTDLYPFVGSHLAKRDFKNLATGDLVIVARPLGFNDVLITGKGITVVHISERGDKLVHLSHVDVLFSIDGIRLSLDDVVKFSSNRQVELVVHRHLLKCDFLILDLFVFELTLLPHVNHALLDLVKFQV